MILGGLPVSDWELLEFVGSCLSSSLTVSQVISLNFWAQLGSFLFQLLHFLILKFLFDFLYFLILSFVIFSFISRAFTITYWSICIIATLSDRFNIFVISVFACVDCLFSCKLRFSWLFICQIILDTIMDILNTTL